MANEVIPVQALEIEVKYLSVSFIHTFCQCLSIAALPGPLKKCKVKIYVCYKPSNLSSQAKVCTIWKYFGQKEKCFSPTWCVVKYSRLLIPRCILLHSLKFGGMLRSQPDENSFEFNGKPEGEGLLAECPHNEVRESCRKLVEHHLIHPDYLGIIGMPRNWT